MVIFSFCVTFNLTLVDVSHLRLARDHCPFGTGKGIPLACIQPRGTGCGEAAVLLCVGVDGAAFALDRVSASYR